ncbi:hypothetical protein BU24DRAFT_265296 [Aaosphaeria arxii CBS 175.79]|uniref:Uncharacterized protein n=1 Tax=Aaosphaeria arxii CBS 175.79 TaxID=1450172 RepID=A0A6A5XFK0_9PLEO|nr:uncharacterized protein BU24DRAFT_265296 [Aaosphaeria arxii CBS 175.79]KAF2011862.1 hypothetical protein BU24DRAFT_265296 [Aaosphaeria arxii CBS 175.79]
MNYANMIEEKNLKKTFIIATLCSTLIGTFTSSMGLWDRVNEKRKQTKRDSKQDGEIKKLKEQIEQTEKRSKEREEQMRRRDEVGDNFERSGALIQRQYDEGYGHLGRRFAVGDQITENKLQAQVIALQQTVIHVLQDALYNDRPLTRADMAKLVAASNSAREGSLDALRQQQQRLSIEGPPPRALSAPKRASTIVEADPLFCRYSLDLQYIPHKPLAADFAPGGNCRCPACGLCVDATADDFWQIGKRFPVLISDGGYEKEVLETREFHLGQRFVIKCHTADGQYACILCNKHRDVDAICRTVDSLVKHVGKFHDMSELEREVDLRESRAPPLALLPPPPPAPQPPPARKEIKEVEVRQYR